MTNNHDNNDDDNNIRTRTYDIATTKSGVIRGEKSREGEARVPRGIVRDDAGCNMMFLRSVYALGTRTCCGTSRIENGN